MKWYSHKAVGLSVSFLFGLPISGIFLTTASSVVPDVVEFGVLKHRGLSHAWWIYALLYIVSIVFLPEKYSIYFSFIALGILLHLICDALTLMGIPQSPFSDKRIAFKLFKTGSSAEYIFVSAIFVLCFFIFIKRGSSIFANDPFLRNIGNLFKFVLSN